VELIVLGLGGMMPMPGRWLTSAVLLHNGKATLFDCGEGTQVPLKKSGFGVGRFTQFVLSHLHADHLTGVPGMLMLMAQAEPDHPLQIVGLPETTRYVRATRDLLRFFLGYQINYTELDPNGGELRGDGYTLQYLPLKHTTPNLGFAYLEDPRPGKFSVENARRLGVPEGPAWGRLQQGETVVVDGREIHSADVLGPPRRGRKFAYVTDTAPCENAVRLLENADLALLEAMFCEEHAPEAAEKMHLTSRQAASIARDSGCVHALLAHVSPRYKNDELRQLETEAHAICDRVELAKPLERYAIPLPD
jgi:ribonuclease Z